MREKEGRKNLAGDQKSGRLGRRKKFYYGMRRLPFELEVKSSVARWATLTNFPVNGRT